MFHPDHLTEIRNWVRFTCAFSILRAVGRLCLRLRRQSLSHRSTFEHYIHGNMERYLSSESDNDCGQPPSPQG